MKILNINDAMIVREENKGYGRLVLERDKFLKNRKV